MADPITGGMAVIGMASSVAGGIIGAQGAEYQGQAQANMYNYQAAVARLNQQIAQQNADYEKEVGEVQAQEQGMKTRQVVGQERAAYGAGNIDVNSGSPMAVQRSELAVGQESQAIIRSNAAHRAYAAEVQGMQDVAQANIYDYSARTSLDAAKINAMSSIIGAAGSVSTKWIQGSQAGMFGGGGGILS